VVLLCLRHQPSVPVGHSQTLWYSTVAHDRWQDQCDFAALDLCYVVWGPNCCFVHGWPAGMARGHPLAQVWCKGSGAIGSVAYGLYGSSTLLWGMSNKTRQSGIFQHFWITLTFVVNR
jgi:hypothetical protein